MLLRDYQRRCVDAVMDSFQKNNTTLVVKPTGCGKTHVFSHVAKLFADRGERVIVIAHRDELISQAKDKLEAITGRVCEVEKADSYVQTGGFYGASPIVVASVQSLISGRGDFRRMHRFVPDDFSLMIVDEAHHAVATSYISTINHFRQNPKLKVLGVTATPDRADEAALGRVFQDVAFEYSIIDAIEDGWLVPIKQQCVDVDTLDFSNVSTTAGDLNGADLARVMEFEENLHGIAVPSLEICGDRKSIVFTVTIHQAERLAEIFNRYKPNSALVVHGKTPEDERREKVAAFRRGDYQFFCNVGVATEGFDVPDVHCIVMGRPTKSRALYSQMLGRATRPLSGLVDGRESSEERRHAIEFSDKPEMVVVDFVGNSGKHHIVHAADVLGGDYEDEVVELARRDMERQPKRVVDALKEAEKKLREAQERATEAKRRNIKAQVTYNSSTKMINEWFEVPFVRDKGYYSEKQLSEKQIATLERNGFVPHEMNYGQAKAALIRIFHRMDNRLCTYKQAKLLEKFGYTNTKSMTFADASSLLNTETAKRGWGTKRIATPQSYPVPPSGGAPW